jgi:predicted nuclease of restriction endonuclease-like (RecB) superfamily
MTRVATKKAPKPKPTTVADSRANADVSALVSEIGAMIESARTRVAVEVLKEARADYAAEIVSTVSRQLAARYGRGFDEKSLRHMLRFAEAFPNAEIVSTASRQLSWSHFKELVYIKAALARDFYLEMCRIEGWSVRQLRERIDSMLFERTALSKKPEAIIRKELSMLREKGEVSPALVFRDPYMLDFLDLADTYSEKDVESAILREIERFILELGSGFAFVERQKRVTLDGDDYYLDLLFFHRRMQRLVAIELKIGDFKPADSGQMELYLRWLNRHERQPSEQSPVGIILCAGKKRETVEYLDLDARGIHVAEYLTELPPRRMLEERLRLAIETARSTLAVGADADTVGNLPRSRLKSTKPRQ